MTHTAHDLQAEFPADAALLHELKLSDAHYQKLAGRHHDINREIHRIESESEAASDTRLEELKKARLSLLDEVAALLVRVRAATA
ncbi:MAG TPA: DUF465 domain-containing protein [Novosphingobium sp.]|nr:DUF465 domain-containing protein [Novosphingobium sp.]HZV11265.1 DUF465 domain-containing protein [Novosphingobium sp.]